MVVKTNGIVSRGVWPGQPRLRYEVGFLRYHIRPVLQPGGWRGQQLTTENSGIFIQGEACDIMGCEYALKKLSVDQEQGEQFDVFETKHNIVVKAEVPGMDSKEINIYYANGILAIKSERKREEEEQDRNYYCCGTRYGAFSRSTRLPHEIQSEKVQVSYNKAILKITLPKSEEAKSKEVKSKLE